MTTIDTKRHIEINEGYQGINLTEFAIGVDELISNDQIVDTFIRSKQFSFDSLRDCVKTELDRDYLRQAFDVDKIKITDFRKTDKQGVSKFLFDFINEPYWGDDRNEFAKLHDRYFEIHNEFGDNEFYILSKDWFNKDDERVIEPESWVYTYYFLIIFEIRVFAKRQNVSGHAMKTTLNIFTGLFLLLTSCNNSRKDDMKTYVESEPTFFELRNGDWLTNQWIRKPENLLTIHETFKKVGYMNLITDNLLFDNPLIIQGIYINKQASHLLDSLELTYNLPDIKDKYYREFWQRRKAEKNDSVVFIIIKDINFAIKNKRSSGGLSLNANHKLVNDTLASLLEIEFRTDRLTKQQAQQDFETLRQLGFHQSAYNLLFKTYKYQDIKWNRDSLERTLKQSDKLIYPWFQDDTK
jgi:hypothetical protein